LSDSDKQEIEVVFKGDMAELHENPHDDPLFKQLAAEEPPMPTLEEIGTVADLRDVVGQVDLARVGCSLARSDDTLICHYCRVVKLPTKPQRISPHNIFCARRMMTHNHYRW